MNATIRRSLYVLTAVGTPLVAWAGARGWIGDLEVTLWSAEVAVISGLAALNTPGTQTVTIEEPATIIPGTTLDVPQSSDAKADAAFYDPKHDADEREGTS